MVGFSRLPCHAPTSDPHACHYPLHPSQSLSHFTALAVKQARAPEKVFHYDGGRSVVPNPTIHDLAHIPSFFTIQLSFSENPEFAMYRPLVLVAHSFNRSLYGDSPGGWLWTDLIIHGKATAVVFFPLCQLGLPPLWG